VWRVYRGVKRLQGINQAATRLPITVELLLELERFHDVGTRQGRLMRAAMWLGTCGLLRAGEFAWRDKETAILTRKQLTFHSEAGQELPPCSPQAAYVKVRLEKSKTDPFRAGTDIIVANNRAIDALNVYLTGRATIPPEGPLFSTDAGDALSVRSLVTYTRGVLERAGVPELERYKGHSFRRGGATSLHLAGQPDSIIKVMGRWRSFTFATYVDTPLTVMIAASRAMAGRSAQGKSVTFASQQHKSWSSPVWDEDSAL
jgi:integrase